MFVTDEIELSGLSFVPGPASLLSGALFFDIETSGVSFAHSHITVIGAAYLTERSMRLCQWFVDTPSAEGPVLSEFIGFLKGFGRLITYNGAGFDVPYVQRRADLFSLSPSVFGHMDHVDLFRYSGPFARLFGLPDRKLKTVEEGLFLERNDRISGADCIALYRGYLSTGDRRMRDLILLHNREDVLNLAGAAPIIAYSDLKQGGFEILGCAVRENRLEISSRLKTAVPRSFGLDLPEYEVFADGDEMRIVFKGSFCEKKLFRKDYRDYYYLIREDCAVHKSVGRFISRENRVQAKASNCYERFEDVFFCQPECIVTPEFRDSRKEGASFFRAKELTGPDMMHALCRCVLTHCVFGGRKKRGLP